MTKNQSGKCRVCGCTDKRGCDGGCFWIDAEHTLCSMCVTPEVILGAIRAKARRSRKAAIKRLAAATRARG